MMPPAAAGSGSSLVHVSIAALALLAWMLCHPYQGLFHDANLYSLQALAHLYPDSLSHDVFLSHGSQDRFTAFSPLFAAAISILGLDHAAALLTVLSQLALVAAAFVVARHCLPGLAAAAGIVLLIALPGDYGPERIFACIEPFLTPRMLAEALTLGMLAAALGRHLALATLLGLAAMAIHPVMALAGLVAVAIHLALQPAWRARRSAQIALAGLLVAAALGALSRGRFDAAWLMLIENRSPYLFLSDWSVEDWTRAAVLATTLLIASLSLPAAVGRVSRVALLTTLAGWVCTLLGADLAHLVLPTQLQPWRWQWLGSVAGALLLPFLLQSLWHTGARGRSLALAVSAAWIFRDGSYALVAALTALGLQLIPALQVRTERLLLAGTVALVVLAAGWRIASSLEFTDVHYMDGALPLQLRRVMSFSKDGLAFALLAGCAVLLARRRADTPQLLFCITLLALAALVLPFSLRAWKSQGYSADVVAKFAAWRSLIPPQSEVLWNESPLGVWALLRRPHYVSGLQTSGMVFSRAAALDLEQRAMTLSTVIPPQNFLLWSGVNLTLPLGPGAVQALCGLNKVQFLVTSTDLGREPVAELSKEDWPVSHGLKLYRCST